ncbi:hypothetical protein CKO27_15395 [Thiocystis violacea]|nr:hypothetical protein [Thiocystis violacea]
MMLKDGPFATDQENVDQDMKAGHRIIAQGRAARLRWRVLRAHRLALSGLLYQHAPQAEVLTTGLAPALPLPFMTIGQAWLGPLLLKAPWGEWH